VSGQTVFYSFDDAYGFFAFQKLKGGFDNVFYELCAVFDLAAGNMVL
jgi:hypothetical protein